MMDIPTFFILQFLYIKSVIPNKNYHSEDVKLSSRKYQTL